MLAKEQILENIEYVKTLMVSRFYEYNGFKYISKTPLLCDALTGYEARKNIWENKEKLGLKLKYRFQLSDLLI